MANSEINFMSLYVTVFHNDSWPRGCCRGSNLGPSESESRLPNHSAILLPLFRHGLSIPLIQTSNNRGITVDSTYTSYTKDEFRIDCNTFCEEVRTAENARSVYCTIYRHRFPNLHSTAQIGPQCYVLLWWNTVILLWWNTVILLWWNIDILLWWNIVILLWWNIT